ncbi:sensor histidine kinase [Massilia violaceinigra]|uniref:Sensor histidine kinase n=1 Tax=Massilia violaceinigra TaxID=2045208 RepID=A0ABY4A0N6_9BURK|nr:sensor histidine kinase [Massilia violaceinigra]UOD28261.1 sensor histidine kinase [Massilia violaceinigra]
MNTIQRPAHTSSHPLDAIALFRRWPCSPWRDVLYTGIWNFLIAVFLTAANMLFKGQRHGFLDFFGPTLVTSNVVGYLIHAVLSGGDHVLRGWPSRLTGLPRVLYFVATVGLCVVAGIAIGNGLLNGVNPLRYLTGGVDLAPLLPFALFAALIMVAVLVSGERRIATETLAARQGQQIASAAQLLAEARLRALQAQIEPHFLYNTLANVVGMIETHPAQARHMLERFIDYLRASLAASRADQATLGAELDLAAAYLDVLAVRMGPRLSYSIEADGCRDVAMPPMLLQPVIENAVAHGLEPKVEGGRIIIRAACRDDQLCIEVSDTGAGLGNAPPKPGGGVGLSNLRARLRSVYGPSARVQLLEHEPCGITVRLLLPLKETLPSTIHAP